MSTSTTPTTTRSSAKKFAFTYNHITKKILNSTIEGSEFNFKKAGDHTSAQYAELMAFKATQPTFKFAPIASTKKVEKKQTYKGLDKALMADYIRIAGSEQAKAEFKHMVADKKNT